MALLDDATTSALANWWPFVAHEAHLGTSLTDAQVIANATAAQAGLSLSFAENRAIGILYGYARRIENSGVALQSASFDTPITPDLQAIPPWARDQQVQNTVPIWHTTFEFTFIDQAGNQVTEWKTSINDMTFPATVGELNDQVQADAEAMAAKYNVTLVSAGLISLLAV